MTTLHELIQIIKDHMGKASGVFSACPLPFRNSQEDEDMEEKRKAQLFTQLSINRLYHV